MSIEEITRTLEERPELKAFMQDAITGTHEQVTECLHAFNVLKGSMKSGKDQSTY